ncbi:MAG TPA: serine/threonine-protein kinase [Streptosporangiaceae bacterium]|nr:serine/threonine-protein kinase [Streptosporangiaceae bacterium]
MPADVSTLLGGRYELQNRVGAGGFSEVWRAYDRVLERPVAIKLLDDKYARDPEALARFRSEAHNAGCLSHGNIARVYDFGEPEPPFPAYLVMELVDGPALSEVLERGPIDAAWCMDVIAQVADGLHEAHQRGLVHRDVKPANLLLSGGVVKVADFGISHAADSASLTMTGVVVGSPGYVAPERASGASATPASDLYALGVVAYECLVGAPPFSGTGLEVALAHVNQPFPELPDHVPAEVAAFVAQLTRKDPALRPPDAAVVAETAAQLRDALLAASAPVVGGPVVAGTAVSAPAATGRRPRLGRTGRMVLAAAAAACLLVSLVLLSTFGSGSAPSAASAGHRSTHGSGQLSRKAAAVSSVVVRSSSLAGLQVAMVVQQLHQLGLTTRVIMRPTAAQPPGTVVAVYPVGRHQAGSQITIVSAERPPPAHQDPPSHRMPATAGGPRCEMGHGPGEHHGRGPSGPGPGSGTCASSDGGPGSSEGSGRSGG